MACSRSQHLSLVIQFQQHPNYGCRCKQTRSVLAPGLMRHPVSGLDCSSGVVLHATSRAACPAPQQPNTASSAPCGEQLGRAPRPPSTSRFGWPSPCVPQPYQAASMAGTMSGLVLLNSPGTGHWFSSVARCQNFVVTQAVHTLLQTSLPNPSLNRTRYGRQRKAGVRRLRHLRTPALRCLP